MKANKNGNGSKTDMTQIVKEGKCYATLYSIIDLWTQTINSKKYWPSEKRRVFITWELPEFMHEFKEWDGEKPCVVSQEYTFSTYGTSHFRGMLESMLGKQSTMKDEEASDYDLENLLGMRCKLKIIHNSPYINIWAIYDLDEKESKEAKKKFPQVNPSVIFDLDEFDKDVFESLPEFLRTKIMKSPEYSDAELKQIEKEEEEELKF